MFKVLRSNKVREKRPPLGTRINWNNPITKGLSAYWPILSQSPTLVEAISGRKFNTNGTPTNCSYYRDSYLNCTANGGGNYGIITPYNQVNDVSLNQPATWLFRFMYDPTSGDAPGILNKSNSNTLATAGWSIGTTGVNSSLKLRVEGLSFSMSALSTFNYASYVFYNVVITWDGTGQWAAVKFYINGRQDITNSSGSNNIGGIQGSDSAINLQIGRDATTNKTGNCKLGNIGLWKGRALSPAEACYLTLNPWCMLDSVSDIILAGKLGFTPITVNQSDALSLSSAPSLLDIGRIITSDGLILIDSVIVPTANTPVSVSDTLVFTDTLASCLGKGYQNFDILILLDQAKLNQPYFFTEGESLALGDIALVYPVISQIIDGDRLSFSDVSALLISGVYKILENDSVTLTDVLTVTIRNFLALFSTFSENILITDAFFTKLTNSLGVFSDTLTIGDLLKIITLGVLKENDSINLSDFVSISVPEGEGLNDLFAISDTAAVRLAIVLQFAETLAFIDVVTRSNSGQSIMLQIFDGLVLTDNPSIILHVLLNSYLRRYLNDVPPVPPSLF